MRKPWKNSTTSRNLRLMAMFDSAHCPRAMDRAALLNAGTGKRV